MRKKTSVSNTTSLVFEELEPRLLLSADGLAVITESSVATIQNIVHADDEHTMIVQQHAEQTSTAVLNNTQNNHRTELVILDSRAPNFQQLHNDIINAQQQGRDINVVILDAHRDGLEQISEALSKYNKLDAVHIVSHGSDGQLQLGATQLNNNTLKNRSSDISAWKEVFTDGGDLLIYGCNLAGTADGKSMIDSLSRLTATDVAASDDLTGSEMLGGDWELEYTVGDIESSVAFSEAAQENWSGTLDAPVANSDSYSIDKNQTLYVVNALTDNASVADLEASWLFNEGAGLTTADTTGNSNDGALINGTAWTTSSRTGNAALSFDGSDDYVQTTGSTLDLSTATNFTLSAWFKTDTTTGQHHILWQGVNTENGWGEAPGTNAQSEMHLTVGRYDADNKITFFMGYHDTSSASIDITSSSDFTDTSDWHHAVVVVQGTGTPGELQADLYIDGVLEGSDTGTEIDRSMWDRDLRIGQGGLSRNFDGMIDEVGIYNTALTDVEVRDLYTSGIIKNDTDADGDILTASIVTGPSNGSLTLRSDGSFTYTPNADYIGTDSFTYKVNDGLLDSNTETVTIDVINNAPVANNDSYIIDEDTTLNVSTNNWWDTDWQYREQITFTNAPASTLTDFPILVKLTGGVNIDYTKVQNAGEDLRFTDADGTPLDYQIEEWDETGTSYVWVRVPQIDTTGTDYITMYYGNGSAADGQNATGVWDANFAGVWHLNEDTTGAGVTISDSTSNANHGVTEGVWDSSASVDAQTGKGLYFDGDTSSRLIRMSDSASLDGTNDAATFSMWINWTDPADGNHQNIMSSSNRFSGTDAGYEWASQGSGNHFFYPEGDAGDANYNLGPNPFTAGQWHHLAVTLDWAAKEVNIYVDGTAMTFTTENVPAEWVSAGLANPEDWLWGGNPDQVTRYFDGIFDEIQVSDTVRSADWITAQYETGRNNLFTFGGVEEKDGVLINDTDADGDSLTATLISTTSNGALTFNTYGSFVYTPNANFNGVDSFVYEVDDGSGNTSQATVSITVNAVNDAPVATDDNYTIAEDQTLVINALTENATASALNAEWQLDEGAGISTVDATGNGNDGTLYNGTAWTTSSRTGDAALQFDGADDYVNLGSDAIIDDVFAGGGTISAWINPAGWGENGYGRILDKTIDTMGSDGWGLQLHGSTGAIRFEHGFDGTRGAWEAPGTIALNTWTHVAIVYDNSLTANDPLIYVNGVSKSAEHR